MPSVNRPRGAEVGRLTRKRLTRKRLTRKRLTRKRLMPAGHPQRVVLAVVIGHTRQYEQ
jgi:hypothetical protein